jgi:hypothetical protein
MRFLRKTKTLQQIQQQLQKQQEHHQHADPKSHQGDTKSVLISSSPASAAPSAPAAAAAVKPLAPIFCRPPGVATKSPSSSSPSSAVTSSPYVATTGAHEPAENVIVMDVADLITAAEIGHVPVIATVLELISHDFSPLSR